MPTLTLTSLQKRLRNFLRDPIQLETYESYFHAAHDSRPSRSPSDVVAGPWDNQFRALGQSTPDSLKKMGLIPIGEAQKRAKRGYEEVRMGVWDDEWKWLGQDTKASVRKMKLVDIREAQRREKVAEHRRKYSEETKGYYDGGLASDPVEYERE